MSNWNLTLYWLHVRTIRGILKRKVDNQQHADSSIDTIDVLSFCASFCGVTSSCPPKLIRAFQSTFCSFNSSTTTRGSTTKAATTVRKASVEGIYGVTTDQHSVQQLPLPFKAFWPPMVPMVLPMPLWFSTASGSIHILFTPWNLDVSVWYYL